MAYCVDFPGVGGLASYMYVRMEKLNCVRIWRPD